MSVRLESNRSNAPLLWGVALLASVAAHVGLFRINPNFLTGSGGMPKASPVRIRPDVQVVPPAPETLRKEYPKLLDRLELPDSSVLDPTVPEEPSELSFASSDSDPALPEVDAAAPPTVLSESGPGPSPESTWTPRQEVLAVTDSRVRETLEVLPRTFRQVETTRPGAPDITLPSETPEFGALEKGDGPGLERVTFHSSRGDGVLSGEIGLAPASVVSPELPPVRPDLPDLETEKEEDTPELIATEDLLQLSVRVYDPVDEPDARYVKFQLKRNGIEALPLMPRDVVFLVDCSASMTEEKLQLSLEGIRKALDSLDESDRIQVIAFRDRVEVFSSEPRPATVFGKAQVRTFLSTLHARGQTDVFSSLEALNQMTSTPKRPLLALLITDGVPTQGIQDTREILDGFARKNDGRVSVFGLGGGERVNRQLLDFLSFRNRGFSLISPMAEGLREVIPMLAAELRRPVLTDLSIQFTGAESPEVYPKSLSHLYVDRPWILIGRLPRTTDRLAFQVVGTSAEGNHDIVFPVALTEAIAGGSNLRREWAWQAGLEKWAEAISVGSEEAFQSAEDFFRAYQLEVPEAYRN